MSKYKYSDGGKRYSRWPKEKNACPIMACAISLNIDYSFVHDIFDAYGRKYGYGSFEKELEKIANVFCAFLGLRFKRVIMTSFFIGDFIDFFPTGTYMLTTRKNNIYHYCACVNGVIYDVKKDFDSREVVTAYKIYK